MTTIDNGGANAIKGFNYQKSVIVLVAVLNYLSENDFEIRVESEDDVVVNASGTETFMQVKSKPLSVATILKREDGKDSILEKNIANGNEVDSKFKLVTPSFIKEKKHLTPATPSILTDGASVYQYSEEGLKQIKDTNSKLSVAKLKNSRVAVTDFGASQRKAWTYIKGVMVNQGIPVDHGVGLATLNELSNQIDQRSEITVTDSEDYKKKVFNRANLQNIFSGTHIQKLYEELLVALGYSTSMKVALRIKNRTIGPIYETYIEQSKGVIRKLNDTAMSDHEVIDEILGKVSFGNDVTDLDQTAIALNAYSQVLFEKEKA